MINRIARPRPSWRRALSAAAATVAVMAAATLLAVPPALAQNNKKKPAPAAKVSQQAGENGKPELMYSPWIKMCGKNQQTANKEVCVISKIGRLENGMPVAVVQLFEPQGLPKMMRVTVPLGMQIQHGTRVIIDNGTPVNEPYRICIPRGCFSDYPVSDDMIKQLKKGKMLTVQAINAQGRTISLPMPLKDFAKASDGPPTDPKVFEKQQRKLQEELQKKAEEARKKLEAQKPGATKK